MSDWRGYIDDVLTGNRLTGRLEKLTVERSVRLMQDDRYYLDQEEVDRVLKIISLFRHTKGSFYGQHFQLFPFQAFFFAMIFGLKRKDTEKRLFRKVLLVTAKKNGKSEIGGALGILMTYFDGEKGAECYSVANKYDQALFSWNAGRIIAKQLAADSESFDIDLKVFNSSNHKALLDTSSESFFKPLAADAKTLDGVNPHFALIDEYHEAKDDDIPNNMSSGMVLRDQPLLCYVTTRGFNVNGPLYRLERVAIEILEGKKTDDTFFPLIFALDKDDDWHDKSLWVKSNPGIGRAPTWDGIEAEYTKALNEGATAEVNFKTKNQNMWVRQGKTWITDKLWMQGDQPIDYESLKGRRCFAAVDLSSRRDLSDFGMLFPPLPGESEYIFIHECYCPEDNAEKRAREDGVPYLEWIQSGDLTATPGDVIDYEYIERDIIEANGLYDIEMIRYDPAFATEIMTRLSERGLNVLEFTQYYKNFNRAITELDRLLTKGLLIHSGDPVLRWCAGNVVIKINATGLQMFDKKKSKEKIDPMVVLAMCMANYLMWLENEAKDQVNISFI